MKTPSALKSFNDGPEQVVEDWGMAALEARRRRSNERVVALASRRHGWVKSHSYFYSSLGELLRHIVETRRRVLVLARVEAALKNGLIMLRMVSRGCLGLKLGY